MCGMPDMDGAHASIYKMQSSLFFLHVANLWLPLQNVYYAGCAGPLWRVVLVGAVMQDCREHMSEQWLLRAGRWATSVVVVAYSCYARPYRASSAARRWLCACPHGRTARQRLRLFLHVLVLEQQGCSVRSLEQWHRANIVLFFLHHMWLITCIATSSQQQSHVHPLTSCRR